MSIVRVYVDGSWKPSTPLISGWGYVIFDSNDEILIKNNGVIQCLSRQVDGELFATISSLEYIRENLSPDRIELFYDYTGIEAWATGKWKAKSIIAKDYLERLEELNSILNKVYFHKVKSHSGGSIGNDLADELAKTALDEYEYKI